MNKEKTGNSGAIPEDTTEELNLEVLSEILEEHNTPHSVMWMGSDAFGNVYRYMLRYMNRYQGTAYKLLFTAHISPGDYSESEMNDMIAHVREVLRESLRNSDIMMQIGTSSFFLMLPEIFSKSLY